MYMPLPVWSWMVRRHKIHQSHMHWFSVRLWRHQWLSSHIATLDGNRCVPVDWWYSLGNRNTRLLSGSVDNGQCLCFQRCSTDKLIWFPREHLDRMKLDMRLKMADCMTRELWHKTMHLVCTGSIVLVGHLDLVVGNLLGCHGYHTVYLCIKLQKSEK